MSWTSLSVACDTPGVLCDVHDAPARRSAKPTAPPNSV